MIIRKFRSADASKTAKMHRYTISYVNSKYYYPKQIRAWRSGITAKNLKDFMKNNVRYVAVEHGEVVGVGNFSRNGELTGLYIDKDHLGKGIGTKLLKRLEKSAIDLGISEFRFYSTINAVKFYKKHNYKVIRKTKFKIKNIYIDAYKMIKKLTK